MIPQLRPSRPSPTLFPRNTTPLPSNALEKCHLSQVCGIKTNVSWKQYPSNSFLWVLSLLALSSLHQSVFYKIASIAFQYHQQIEFSFRKSGNTCHSSFSITDLHRLRKVEQSANLSLFSL